MGTVCFPLPDDLAEVVALINTAQPGTNYAFVRDADGVYVFHGDQSCYFAGTLAEGGAFLAGAFYDVFRGAPLAQLATRYPPAARQLPTDYQHHLTRLAAARPLRERLPLIHAANPFSWPAIGFDVLPETADLVRLLNATGQWRLALAAADGAWAVQEHRQRLFHSHVEQECFAFLAACFVHTFHGRAIDDIVEGCR